MASNKRKNVFKSEFEKEFGGIKKSRKGEGYFYCSLCDDDINLESMGKTAITQHQKSAKHMNAVKIRNANQKMNAFLPSKSAPSSIDFSVAAAEGNEFRLKFYIDNDNPITKQKLRHLGLSCCKTSPILCFDRLCFIEWTFSITVLGF